MLSLREAQFRHASHFEGALRASNELYERGGSGIAEAIACFEAEWENIRIGQEWAASRPRADEDAAALCSDYLTLACFCYISAATRARSFDGLRRLSRLSGTRATVSTKGCTSPTSAASTCVWVKRNTH